MRKMYFAMIPKGGFLGKTLGIAALGVGAWFAYKYYTDDEKESTVDFTTKVKDVFFDKAAQQEEDLAARIRRAAKNGINKLTK